MNLKVTVYLWAIFILISCKNSPEPERITDTILDTSSVIEEKDKVIAIENNVGEEGGNDIEILLPTRYRDWENKNAADNLTGNWIELYEKNGIYFLGKADYSIERGFDECSGDSTKTITTKNKTLILLEDNLLKLGEVETAKFSKNKVWPTESVTIHFNDVDYSLRAEGKVMSSEKVSTDNGTEIFKNVRDYKLYISAEGAAENLFLQQESFNDTFVEILFIGDIDRDGKPDFIFSANRDYEEERVILYLSSKAKEGKIIKKMAEIAVQFDC